MNYSENKLKKFVEISNTIDQLMSKRQQNVKE